MCILFFTNIYNKDTRILYTHLLFLILFKKYNIFKFLTIFNI